MEKILDWVEKNALENLRFRLANAETLAKDAGNLLTLMLAGMAGGLAYVFKGIEANNAGILVAGSAAFTLWVMVCAIVLLWRCVLTADMAVPTNEPGNLCPAYTMALDEARQFELENIQERIDAVKVRNRRVAFWLDRLRIAAALSPLGFALGAAAMWWIQRG